VHASPDGPVTRTLANPIPSGAPLTFLLARRSGEWLKVYLPQRPNGSTGWVRGSDVRLYLVPYRLDVLRSEHRLRVYRSGALVHSYPIGVGTGSTPTPGGTFYLKELIRTPNPGGAYGPYAYGLSGFSNVLTSFGGGDGVIGLHGTNDPSSVGRDVSHGCIRLRNSDITALTLVLPLGTPVRILA
jgi:lipoprotein-anchoring transpeptidase ErfK/SrfK